MTDGGFKLEDVQFIKRVVVGSVDPQRLKSEQEIAAEVALVNKCLTSQPRGHLLNIDENSVWGSVGDQPLKLQYTVYHIGFARKPLWLSESGE